MNYEDVLMKLWAWTYWYGARNRRGARYGPVFLKRGFDQAPASLRMESRNTVTRLNATRQCAYCGGPVPENSTGDHIVPLALGGPQSAENRAPCCRSCNSSKSDRDLLDWWVRQRSRSIEGLNVDLLRIYLRLMCRLLEGNDRLLEEAPDIWVRAVAQAEGTFDAHPLAARLREIFNDSGIASS